MSLSGGVQEAKRMASFTHDAGGTETLFTYRPEPAEITRQGEQMANRLYGIIDTRSPKTPYICAWRDTDPERFRRPEDMGPPLKILFGATFGTEPWSPPAGLVEYATQASQRDQAHVTLGWENMDGTYRLNRFEVVVTNLAANRDFRSVWYNEEPEQILFDRFEIQFPASPIDCLRFNIAATVPRRYNQHERPEERKLWFMMAGSAPPIPDWVLY